jgi:hypothetical protein
MKPIAIFYHCLFCNQAGQPVPGVGIIKEQLDLLESSGLMEAASKIYIGINGGFAGDFGRKMPLSTLIELHSSDNISETPTMVKMWEFSKVDPGWNVLYFHAKGATHTDPEYLKFVGRWRNCMMRHLVQNWRTCIEDLDSGFESVGCHWMTNMSPPSDKDAIWGGNFFWATSDFIATLPDLLDRDLIKQHGRAAPIARYEGERWIGSGPRRPNIKDYHVNGIGQCP